MQYQSDVLKDDVEMKCVLQGAFWGLFLGLLVGGVRMALDFIYPSPLCYQEDSRPDVVKHVHYLYFSTMLSLLTLVVVVGVSLATEKPSPEQVRGGWGVLLNQSSNTVS